MAKDNVAEDLRAELKTLADTLEEVLNSSTDKSKEEIGKLRSKAESALKGKPCSPGGNQRCSPEANARNRCACR
ncbi:membrane protein YqjD [Klebsiella michiganensis]|uniref:Membrane protein YqjD n=1 Tax=Klebsiella michiganensis TaxID=1134687 RepID=A0A7H4PHE4_9ENTR|nr:membrane protein YqjD [Klebsiella michiganensis]